MLIRARIDMSVDGFIAPLPHESYGWPELDEQIDAVVLGRVALDAGRRAGTWPWPGKQIFVLTSRPVPADVPADVVPFSPPATPRMQLQLREHHVFPDGTVRHVYTLA